MNDTHRPSKERVSDYDVASCLDRYKNNKNGVVYLALMELMERRAADEAPAPASKELIRMLRAGRSSLMLDAAEPAADALEQMQARIDFAIGELEECAPTQSGNEWVKVSVLAVLRGQITPIGDVIERASPNIPKRSICDPDGYLSDEPRACPGRYNVIARNVCSMFPHCLCSQEAREADAKERARNSQPPADRLREAERLLRECSEDLDFESSNAELLSASIGIFLDGAPSTKSGGYSQDWCEAAAKAEEEAGDPPVSAGSLAADPVETLEQRQHELPADAKAVLYGRIRELQRKDASDETSAPLCSCHDECLLQKGRRCRDDK